MSKVKCQKPNTLNGFTLIEVLLYSAILGAFLSFAFVAVNSMVLTSRALEEKNELLANQEFVERKLESVFSEAKSVLVPLPNSSSTTELRLTTHTTSTNPAVFTVSGNTLFLSRASGTPVALTNSRVNVVGFLAEHVSNSQASSSVSVSVTLEDAKRVNSSSTLRLVFTISP